MFCNSILFLCSIRVFFAVQFFYCSFCIFLDFLLLPLLYVVAGRYCMHSSVVVVAADDCRLSGYDDGIINIAGRHVALPLLRLQHLSHC